MWTITRITSLLVLELALYVSSYRIGFYKTKDFYTSQAYHFMLFHCCLFLIFFIIPCLKCIWMFEKFYMFLFHCVAISMHSIRGIIMLASEQIKLQQHLYAKITVIIFAGMLLLFWAAIAWDLGLWFDFEDPSFGSFINYSTFESVNKDIHFKRRQNLIDMIPWIKFTRDLLSEWEIWSVWLRNYIENELIKILPNCYHLFHIDCILKWFMRSNQCPYWRSQPNYYDIMKLSKLSQDELHQKVRSSHKMPSEGQFLS